MNQAEITFDYNNFVVALEPLLRKIVREELAAVVKTRARLSPRKKIRRKPVLEMVDAETNERIGQALANIKQGNYVQLDSPKEIKKHFRALFEKNDLSD